MKRILWTTVLAGLLIAATGANVAVAEGNQRIVIRPIFASDILVREVGPAVGIVTFDTETGDWTVTTRNRLPQADYDIYSPSISTSPVSTLPRSGRRVEAAYTWAIVTSVDGVIAASGTVTPEVLDLINQALADGGIFLLGTNFT